ncbi:DUF58 domain-containing protein [Pseudoxanthomonas dokdonensis]|uniref:von Willebrand factor A n=1 Tax=Pseudoxanthomonas dokdonensis TaxID=344882 RepID=A0A0R0CRW1_9GAMM|nr:DUF58 domain-containing protein [Pseudoxanthomonas dokdonensis]KRG72022.1 von Willebrand factor A [Pseudoxanthomonas dokdonensis]
MQPPLIPADVRSRLKDLRLLARRASGQRGVGLHHSRSRGAGLEFAQYRGYEPGDELRQIDWKLYARSDRFFVREAERESPLTVWLLIDGSASMQQIESGDGRSRLQAAQILAACIAELALRQGDRFGFIGLCSDGLQLLGPGQGSRHRDRLWLALQRMRAHGGLVEGDQLLPVWQRIAANDLVIALGDFFDDASIALCERLAAAGREVIALPILSSDERDFPFRGGHLFVDPETGEQLPGDAASMREDYLRRFGQARQGLQARLQAAGIRHATCYMDQPLDQPLRQLFAGRAGTGPA